MHKLDTQTYPFKAKFIEREMTEQGLPVGQ